MGHYFLDIQYVCSSGNLFFWEGGDWDPQWYYGTPWTSLYIIRISVPNAWYFLAFNFTQTLCLFFHYINRSYSVSVHITYSRW